MDEAARKQDSRPGDSELVAVSAAYEGDSADIAQGRALARDFLERLQAVHGLPVSARALGTVQLVVSELLTNAIRHAPGPCLLDLALLRGSITITVWDSASVLFVGRNADPGRVGQHGLEIVMAVSQSFEVHREPVGKRTTASVMLADDPGGDVTGHRPLAPRPPGGE
ncbi:anti-sigma regulatory factor (Ser/Thr protein kinase) [Streptomyces sp. V3I8]|jgi:anti-sigma regulatory factor (Ser/Thr protein kinase)|uniref:ATP-binding protein n=1 Tax=Streptomyces sp. V3I8 TaxID=3042279 RepID=UPI0027864637|nr:ATP-binding protein [Streptomyces sp. V3I8]MDQ1041698.1 anti-sigma regulatory factor (Ser/Thr protein kinase) [Streptomyces sp. V3I8]